MLRALARNVHDRIVPATETKPVVPFNTDEAVLSQFQRLWVSIRLSQPPRPAIA